MALKRLPNFEGRRRWILDFGLSMDYKHELDDISHYH